MIPVRSAVLAVATGLVAFLLASSSPAADPWLVVEGGEGPGKGKRIVLVSGDEEYRSEEALSQLAKILAKHHGFHCTVLYAIDPKTGAIDPNTVDNIPGLEALRLADLMVIATRFRNLPDGQMKEIDDYLRAGKPVVGMRTATHAFNVPKDRAFHHYSWDQKGEKLPQGFGRQVLGETWISHHGSRTPYTSVGPQMSPSLMPRRIGWSLASGAMIPRVLSWPWLPWWLIQVSPSTCRPNPCGSFSPFWSQL